MKTFLRATAVVALSGLSALPCRAQTPAPPPAPLPSSAASPIPHGPPLQTRVFEVPQDFLSKGSDVSDPFARKKAPDWLAVFQQLGVEFTAPGAKVIRGPGRWEVTMTNTPEQLHNTDSVLNQRFGVGTPRQGQVHLEAFSLPPLTARKALIDHPKERDLYAWIETELAKPESTVKLERHSITIVRGSQKAKTEGINEIPAPTEFNGPQIPQTVTLPSATPEISTPDGKVTHTPWPRTEPQPQSFVFRNAGDTFELELSYGDDGKSVDLNLAPETTRRVGIAKFGLLEDIYQPIYETQKCSVQASGLIGQPILISTFSPPVNTGVPGGNQVDRTWLLFVTVKEPE